MSEDLKFKGVVAIQGAMDVEISVFLEAMGTYEEETIGIYSFYKGEIEGIPVIISRTEVGMIHAAASTALLIQKYNPEIIINQGTAGGHDPNLAVFDTIIAEEVMNIGSFRTEHIDKGKGMAPDKWIHMESYFRENGEIVKLTTLHSHPELVEKAKIAASHYKHGKVVIGKIGSADVWNREIDRIHWFHTVHGTSAEEMEAFAVAKIAKAFDVPYLSIRTISNSEVIDDDTEDLTLAGKYCAEYVIEVVKEIKGNE